MCKSLLVRSLIVAALVGSVCGAVTLADHSWNGYHWARTTNPFTLKVGDNVSSEWDWYLDEALFDWSASSVLDLTKVTGGTRPRNCRPTAGRIEVCNDRYGYTGWLGIAQIWITGGVHIAQAISKMNDSYFSSSPYNTGSWRELVMCQEVAHDFGLDHQDENFDNPNLGTCMDYTSNPDGPPSNVDPNRHDYDELDIIYSHLDDSTTIGASTLPNAMPPAMGQIDFDTPAQWGRLIRSNANRRVQVYELDFGRGNKVVTEVFWADPAADAR